MIIIVTTILKSHKPNLSHFLCYKYFCSAIITGGPASRVIQECSQNQPFPANYSTIFFNHFYDTSVMVPILFIRVKKGRNLGRMLEGREVQGWGGGGDG